MIDGNPPLRGVTNKSAFRPDVIGNETGWAETEIVPSGFLDQLPSSHRAANGRFPEQMEKSASIERTFQIQLRNNNSEMPLIFHL